MTTTTAFRYDPSIWLESNTEIQAALTRRIAGLPACPGDVEVLDKAARRLVSYLRSKGTHHHESFQKSYGEALLREFPDFRDATARVIEAQWASKRKIGHYELYSALVMDDQDSEVLAPTLEEIHNLLKSWNNEGWCPWTPALWLRILWLGRHQLDSSAAIDAQLEYIEDHLSDEGLFQDREPFCLMHAIGGMGHPVTERLRDRFVDTIAARQDPDGGWGEFSYIAYVLLRRWASADGREA